MLRPGLADKSEMLFAAIGIAFFGDRGFERDSIWPRSSKRSPRTAWAMATNVMWSEQALDDIDAIADALSTRLGRVSSRSCGDSRSAFARINRRPFRVSGQRRPMSRAFAEHKRLYQSGAFTSILRRFFRVRIR